MDLIETREGFRRATSAARARGARVGLVPTMGSLHEGHLSLLRAAVTECDVAALTIFVNPIQFGSAEDLARYPSEPEHDLELARAAGAEIVFAPSVAEMYPGGTPETRVEPGPLADHLEGASRPGHFSGVATVVTKLLSLCGGCRAYFGEKDFQQLVVVRSVVADLDLDAHIVACPTVREPDGLACSSRNRRLDAADRAAAGVLFKALMAAEACASAAGATGRELELAMSAVVNNEARAKLDYAVVVDPVTLQRRDELEGELLLLISAEVGPVRLIDNMGVQA